MAGELTVVKPVVLQCQIPPCTLMARHPARTPLLCERHYSLDTRQGKFCPLLMWMTMLQLSWYWRDQAQEAKERGETVDLDVFRSPISVTELTDRVIQRRHKFFETFPRSLRESEDGKYIAEVFVYLKNKPQVYMLGIYLRMVDSFEGLSAARVTAGRPRLTAYINAPPSWVETHILRLQPFTYPTGPTLLVIEHPWEKTKGSV